ncbi:hypothetical protein VCRA2133E348_110063 [Vibrio crassostreae]|nr:hypothetical protein VCRA2133E348_110063 [Vibrio crassostreae]CAK3196153.1 hypothetical protein VCRA213O314_160087 [Vibrio crassostreae]
MCRQLAVNFSNADPSINDLNQDIGINTLPLRLTPNHRYKKGALMCAFHS